MKKILRYFNIAEWIIWISSLILITVSFMIFDGESYISFIASLLGSTALIFCAKGNPIGQIIVIIFSILYAYISFTFAYYGEMITYLGMSAPMAVYAFIAWMKNPYNGKHSEVKVNKIMGREWVFLFSLSIIVTVIFFFILKVFGTSNLIPSTVSITTSFVASWLTLLRSPYYAIAYSLNDIVLIVLWVLATMENLSYLPMVLCFVMFFLNDMYGFFNWRRMAKRQKA